MVNVEETGAVAGAPERAAKLDLLTAF